MPDLHKELLRTNAMEVVSNQQPYINDNKEQIASIRKRFKDNLSKKVFHERCPVTGITFGLIASHIKPLAVCLSEEECIDPANGLLVSKNIDALFDKGHISFDDDGRMLASQSVSASDYELMVPESWLIGKSVLAEMRNIQDQDRRIAYMRYHRYNVFRPLRSCDGTYKSHADSYRWGKQYDHHKDGIDRGFINSRKYRNWCDVLAYERKQDTGIVYSTDDYKGSRLRYLTEQLKK
jgi:hypothetical protein